MLCKQPKSNVDATDSEDRTALMYASECGNYDCVEVLLEYKSNVLAVDQYGCNALHYAVCAQKQE
jgi:ankyrin repeat protein